MKFRCRCCESEWPAEPVLKFDHMPKSAQRFPAENEIENERGVDIRVYQCPYCGLMQLEGEPVSYFREVIRAVGISPTMRQFREEQFGRFLQKYGLKGKRLLEPGAGTGEYMEVMQAAGGDTYGLEYASDSVHKASQRGLKIHRGFLEAEDSRVPGAPYDGFYIMNFLEHIPFPNRFLKAVFNNLSVDAAGLVEVPNVDMIIKENLFSEFISDHLMYFTEKTLCLLLEKNGFEVMECKPVWYNYIISAEVKKRSQLNASGFYTQKDRLTASMQAYLDEKAKEGKRVAAWGAGHQALTALALSGAEGKLCCVIDSAPFKQGLYTPATHIPVAAPQRLKQRDIEAVIIMAAGYSEEIAGILEREYPWVEVVILETDGIRKAGRRKLSGL